MRQPHKLLSQDSRRFTQAKGTTCTAHNVTVHKQGGRNHQHAPRLYYLSARANVKSVQRHTPTTAEQGGKKSEEEKKTAHQLHTLQPTICDIISVIYGPPRTIY